MDYQTDLTMWENKKMYERLAKYPIRRDSLETSQSSFVYQNPENIFPIVDKRFLTTKNSNYDKNKLEIGGIYEYQPPICDDYQIPSRKYELKHIIEKNGLEFLIVKPLSQDGHFVSIPRHICDYMGIPFEHGLTMLSKNIKLTRVIEKIIETEFDGVNMTTYPLSNDKKLYSVILKLSGFTSYRPTHFITSNGHTMSPSDFVKSLQVLLRIGDNLPFFCSYTCSYEIITNAIVSPDKIQRGCICDEDGNIFLLVTFPIPLSFNTLSEKPKIQDILCVRWTEGSKTDVNDLYGTMSRVNEELMKDGVVRVDDYGNAEIRKNGRWCRLSTEEFNKIRGHLQ